MASTPFRHLKSKVASTSGQGTVEYAVVLAALVTVIVGLGALAGLFREGVVTDHALFSASHHIAGDAVGAVLDVFAF